MSKKQPKQKPLTGIAGKVKALLDAGAERVEIQKDGTIIAHKYRAAPSYNPWYPHYYFGGQTTGQLGGYEAQWNSANASDHLNRDARAYQLQVDNFNQQLAQAGANLQVEMQNEGFAGDWSAKVKQ